MLPTSATLARLAFGAVLLLSGVHKLLDPGAWAVYVADRLVPWLVVSPVVVVLLDGVLEVGFGLALLTDRFTAVAVAAASLTATAGYLLVVWVRSGRFGDVAVRDVGLAGLAWAVLVEAMRE